MFYAFDLLHFNGDDLTQRGILAFLIARRDLSDTIKRAFKLH